MKKIFLLLGVIWIVGLAALMPIYLALMLKKKYFLSEYNAYNEAMFYLSITASVFAILVGVYIVGKLGKHLHQSGDSGNNVRNTADTGPVEKPSNSRDGIPN